MAVVIKSCFLVGLSKLFRYFAEVPHPAGGQRNLDLGAEVKKRWESYGFDDVFNNDYEVLLSLPTEERLTFRFTRNTNY